MKIKHCCILFLLPAFFTLPLHAQHFRGGALLGINASQVDGDRLSGYNKLGLMIGSYVYYPLSPKLDLQIELKYMGKGAKKKTTENDLTQYTSDLNYIEVPLLLRLNTKIKIGWEAGLGFGYLFSYKEKNEYGAPAPEDATHFKSFELSSLIGATYPLTDRITINLRYSYSLLSIFNQGGYRGYNNLFSTGVYVRIGQ